MWEVELTDHVLSTLDAEQRPCRCLASGVEEELIPLDSPVLHLALPNYNKHQSSQSTTENTGTRELEPVGHRMDKGIAYHTTNLQ